MGFIDGTKILCMVNGNEVYIPIQELKHGNLIKTLKSGVKRIEMIGWTTLRKGEEGTKDKFYIYTKDSLPELTDDLVITGGDYTLVDSLTPEQNERTIRLSGLQSLTEGKQRLMTCLDSRAQELPEEGNYTIWYIVLENVYRLKNYGIYANGLLVESTSKDSFSKDATMNVVHNTGPPIRAEFANRILGSIPSNKLNKFN